MCIPVEDEILCYICNICWLIKLLPNKQLRQLLFHRVFLYSAVWHILNYPSNYHFRQSFKFNYSTASYKDVYIASLTQGSSSLCNAIVTWGYSVLAATFILRIQSQQIYFYYMSFSFKISTFSHGIDSCLVFKLHISFRWKIQGILHNTAFLLH